MTTTADTHTKLLTGERADLLDVLQKHRGLFRVTVEGMSDEQARTRSTISELTLGGLVKHVTYVEGVWFDQALSGRSYADIGIATTPDRSFTLTKTDTVASVSDAYGARTEASRQAARQLHLSVVVDGRGVRPVWALYLQVLRELAQHAGHADILREQVLAQRQT